MSLLCNTYYRVILQKNITKINYHTILSCTGNLHQYKFPSGIFRSFSLKFYTCVLYSGHFWSLSSVSHQQPQTQMSWKQRIIFKACLDFRMWVWRPQYGVCCFFLFELQRLHTEHWLLFHMLHGYHSATDNDHGRTDHHPGAHNHPRSLRDYHSRANYTCPQHHYRNSHNHWRNHFHGLDHHNHGEWLIVKRVDYAYILPIYFASP